MTVSPIRDLRGVVEREQAVIGVFITLELPTEPMRREALAAGFYEPPHLPGQRYLRLQILTIAELLAGARIQYPSLASVVTFKSAKRQRKQQVRQETFGI